MSIGVLIVGLGQIGMGYDLALDPARHVYSHARAFSLHPRFHLVGAVDPDPDRRAKFCEVYQRPAYADLDSALVSHEPGVVVIATPTALHRETLFAVLERCQPRVVLCEKPLAYDAEEAREMVGACADRGVSLYVNYFRRSVPGFVEIRKRIDSGEIAVPVKGVAWYSKGFLHNGSHLFNLLEYLLGPVQDACVMDDGGRGGTLDPELDCRVKFQNGDVVFLAAWEEAFSHYTVELVSRSGRLRCEQGGESILWQPAIADAALGGHYRTLSQAVTEFDSGMLRYQWHVVDQLVRRMDEQPAQLCTGQAALATLVAMRNIASMAPLGRHD